MALSCQELPLHLLKLYPAAPDSFPVLRAVLIGLGMHLTGVTIVGFLSQVIVESASFCVSSLNSFAIHNVFGMTLDSAIWTRRK